MREVAHVIFENERGELLLYLRDNKPGIPFPRHWDLFGGHLDEGETPEEALVREVEEELGIELTSFQFFRRYECLAGDAYPNIKHVYTASIAIPADELQLGEGERLQYFARHEILGLKIANILKDVLLDYIDANGGM